MSAMKIVDKNGRWFTSFSKFRFHDPESDTMFEPGVPTKATPTSWLEAQNAIIKPTDEYGAPVEDAEPAKAVKK